MGFLKKYCVKTEVNKMDVKTLNEILEKNKLWLDGDAAGERANLRWADLRWANLTKADLTGANLTGADLISLNLPFYTAYIQKTHTRIGCKYYHNEKWKAFTDKEIQDMDGNALESWNKYKQVVFSAMESLK